MSESVASTPSLAPRVRRFNSKSIAPLASLLVIVALMIVFTGGKFFSTQNAINVLKNGAVLMIVSAGLTYVMLCGEIDLAVGMIALWTAMLCGWCYQRYAQAEQTRSKLRVEKTASDKPPNEAAAATISPVSPVIPLILAGSLATGVALGVLSGTLTVWARMPSFIITLAMMFIASGAARYLSRSETLPVPNILHTLGNRGIVLKSNPTGLDVSLPYSVLLAAIVALVGHLVLQHTRFGRYVYMTGGNREAARLSGVRTGLIVVACLGVSGFTAGLGGLVNSGRLNSISLDQNTSLLLSAVACVVLGGTSLFGGEGGIGRTVIGVVTFTVLNTGLPLIPWIDELARELLMGLVLLSALVVYGLLAQRSD